MFVALSLLVANQLAAAQDYSEATRSFEGAPASRFLNPAQEGQNKAIVRRVYDEIFGHGKIGLVNEIFSEILHSTQPDASEWTSGTG